MAAHSMEFGKRLLPQVVDHHARTEPSRVYASVPKSAVNLSDGFQDVTMAELANIVNRLSWWLESTLGVGSLNAIAYIGPADIRYSAIFLAAVKCRYKMLFISPRNQVAQNRNMLVRAGCEALFHAEEVTSAAASIRESLPHVMTKSLPSLDEILETRDDTKHYPFNKSFDEAQNEPCLILHSSGSTGDPKLVTMTHGTFAVTDNDRNMPTPEGRRPQNASQFNFEGGGKFYSCFPPYHLAGVQAYINLPIFSTSATVVFGPTQLPPSGYLLSETLRHQDVRALYVPPYVIEQWSTEPVAFEQAKQLDFVLFGGGPLSPHIGNSLSKVTDICQMYGSLEVGQVQLLVPQPGEWAYLELNPFEEADMQPVGDGASEMVLHQDPKFATRRSLWHNFPAVKSWRTGDLFIPHPSKPGLWRFHSRVDDLIVLSSSHKLRPVEMETIIQGDPLLSGALIVGQGKPEPLLIVEPATDVYDGNNGAFIDRIWHSIEKSNTIAPTYAKLKRSKVLIASPKMPFVRAPKGTIVRKLTTQAYADEIEAAYEDKLSHADSNNADIRGIDAFVLPGIKQYVRRHVEACIPDVVLSDSDNIFLRGLDSLGAAELSKKLQAGLASQVKPPSAPIISLRMLYTCPTIEGLASVIADIIFGRDGPETSISRNTKSMERAVEDFTANLPPKTVGATAPSPGVRINVVLIGPRGSLGPNIVRELMLNPRVGRLFCLNRGEDGREKIRATFEHRGLPCDVDDARLSFMPIELDKPKLGLSEAHYAELSRNAHIIIHNAWKVNFSLTLDSYKLEYLQSIRHMVDLAAQSILRPRIVFVSSISSVQEWASIYPTPVTEAPLESYDVVSPLGYSQSKHVSERILAIANAASGIPTTILRVGQVAGPTTVTGGQWSTSEWIPSLAAISKRLKLIPTDIPAIDWVPVDLMARAICELALLQQEEQPDSRDAGKEVGQFRIFNVVNPHLSEWAIFVDVLRKRLGPTAKLVTLAEWVHHLALADPTSMSKAEALSSVKILPFFQHLAETAARGTTLQPKFETAEGVKASQTMAEMRAVDKALIDLWCQQWGI